jgi:hypothetical protein
MKEHDPPERPSDAIATPHVPDGWGRYVPEPSWEVVDEEMRRLIATLDHGDITSTEALAIRGRIMEIRERWEREKREEADQ